MATPATPAKPTASQANPAADPSMSAAADVPCILIVDDSRMVRATIARHLKGKFTHVEAVDGEDGWSKLSIDPSIRAVISDLGMPKLDGFGLISRIRESDDSRIRALPVVIISGDDESTQMKRASELGATEFISKGIGAVELVARLENLTALTQAREERDSARVAVAQNATTDPLTQLGTMALLVKQGASMYSYARRHRVPLSVVRIRIDDFEKLRTRIGEGVTDQIVAGVARLLTSRLRKEDVIARTDGAEFSIAAPAAAAAAAAKFARRLVDDIRGARITWRGKSVKISACIGIADSTQGRTESFADILANAGRRLARARVLDRNRVVFEDAPEDGVPGRVPLPSIDEALDMLAAGRGGELRAIAGDLATRIFPLVKFCDDQFTVAERTRIETAATMRLPTLKPD